MLSHMSGISPRIGSSAIAMTALHWMRKLSVGGALGNRRGVACIGALALVEARATAVARLVARVVAITVVGHHPIVVAVVVVAVIAVAVAAVVGAAASRTGTCVGKYNPVQ